MKVSSRSTFSLSSILFTELVLALASQAQSYKLAGPFLPESGGGDVLELRASPDGTRVAYRGDGETYGVIELFSAPAHGSAPAVKLSGAMTPGGNVAAGGFAFSPDGAWVVYLADQTTDGVAELFAVPSDGSAAPVKLNEPLTAGGNVAGGAGRRAFAISADSQRVVYRADQTVDEHFDLWSASIDGASAPVELGGNTFTLVGTVFELSSQGRVVFPASTSADGTELLSAPIDGAGAPIALTQLGPPSIPLFDLSADGIRAVFVSSQTSPSTDQRLWSVPVDGSAGATLLTPAAQAQIESLRISTDASRVVYRASVTAAPVFELFSVPLDGSAAPVRLHAPFAAGRNVVAGQYDITVDSARVLFVADVSADDVNELWSSPLDGSASPVRLSGALAPGADVTAVFGTSRIGAGERVVYDAGFFSNGTDLFSVPADGSGAALKLNGALTSVDATWYSPDPDEPPRPFGSDHSRVVFTRMTFCGPGEDFYFELYTVPVDASAAPERLNGSLHACGGVGAWDIAGDRVVFSSDQDRNHMFELYSAPLDGSSGSVKLNGPMPFNPPESYVDLRALTPDGARAVYVLRFLGEGETQDALFSVPTDASAPPVQLQPPVSQFEQILSLALSPDGARVVFNVFYGGPGPDGPSLRTAPLDGSAPAVAFDHDTNSGLYVITPDSAHVITLGESERIFRAPIDASAPGEPLTPAPVFGDGHIEKLVLSPDGSTVVFVQEFGGVNELYAVPTDGGAPVRKLNPPLVANGDVGDPNRGAFVVLVSPDSARVVYLADQEVDERFELYSVPLAGGPATKLNRPLVAGGDVFATYYQQPVISPDSAHVLYLADQRADEVYELFSVPLAGGPSVALNGALIPSGDVLPNPLVSPDGQRVVFSADKVVDERYELYSVPIAGGKVVRLNRGLVAGGDVSSAQISPDGARVVYLADQTVDGRFELFSRPIDGSEKPRELNVLLPSGGDVGSFQITADGSRVVYMGDAAIDGRSELYEVPIAGGRSIRLNGTLVPGGEVAGYLVSSDGRLVVYSGDQDTEGMYELFAAPLRAGTGPRASRR